MADITMYTNERCPYCIRAKRLLDAKGVEYEEINLSLDTDARRRLIELTGRYTVPQIIAGDEPLGGYDEIKALDAAGHLDAKLGVA